MDCSVVADMSSLAEDSHGIGAKCIRTGYRSQTPDDQSSVEPVGGIYGLERGKEWTSCSCETIDLPITRDHTLRDSR